MRAAELLVDLFLFKLSERLRDGDLSGNEWPEDEDVWIQFLGGLFTAPWVYVRYKNYLVEYVGTRPIYRSRASTFQKDPDLIKGDICTFSFF